MNLLMLCEKCAIIDSLSCVFLFNVPVVPTVVYCHKSEDMAFVFITIQDYFFSCLRHCISCINMFGTGQKYEIPRKPCLPNNCYLMPHAA